MAEYENIIQKNWENQADILHKKPVPQKAKNKGKKT